MKKVINFESVEQFQAYRRQKTCRELGEGSEGICYLGKDGKAYKDFTVGYLPEEYLVDEVITTDDVDVKSFIFPDTLFAVDGKVVGYTCKCITKDDLDYKYLFMNGIDHINFDKLIAAYETMNNDALVLANHGIRIFDLSYNIMFDGNNLYGIDTCGYTRDTNDLCQHNLFCVSQAIKDLFCTYAASAYGEKLDKNWSVIPFLGIVERNYKSAPNNGKAPYQKK